MAHVSFLHHRSTPISRMLRGPWPFLDTISRRALGPGAAEATADNYAGNPARSVRGSGDDVQERELDAMLDAVNLNVMRFGELRKAPIENDVAPPLYFNPIV